MRKLILITFLLYLFGCASTPTPPETEMRAAVLKYLASQPVKVDTRIIVKGAKLQLQKEDVYLVFADVEVGERARTETFIGQKFQEGEKSYWQIIPATPENLRAVGIYNPDGK